KEPQQAFPSSVFRDNDVGSRLHQPPALPGVDAAALDLIAGNCNGHTANPLHLLDLDKTIAEAEQLLAAEAVLLQDALNDHLLGEVVVVIESTVNVLPEIVVQAKQPGFLANVFQVGTAGQVQGQPAALQLSQQ